MSSGAATGAGGGAVSGATAGSMFGPWGTAIGAAVGALAGGLSGNQQDQAKKQAAVGSLMAANGNNSGLPNILNAASQLAPNNPSSLDLSQFDATTNFDPSQWTFSMPPAATAATPATPPPAGQGSATPGMAPNQIPQVPQIPAWQQALAATGATQQAINQEKIANASMVKPHSPGLFVPTNIRPPTLGSAPAQRVSPIDAYIAMLRR